MPHNHHSVDDAAKALKAFINSASACGRTREEALELIISSAAQALPPQHPLKQKIAEGISQKLQFSHFF